MPQNVAFFMDTDIKTDPPKVYTENPFSYNYVAKQQSKVNDLSVPGRDDVVANSDYSLVGKMMGLKTAEDWNKNYDKIFTIAEWAKERSGLKDPNEIVQWIQNMKKYNIPLGSTKMEIIYNNIKNIGKNE